MGKWEEIKFEELIESSQIGLVKGKKEQSISNMFYYFKMNNIGNDGKTFLNDLVKVDAKEEEVLKYELKYGDFLFNTRNSIELVGKTCVYLEEQKMLYNNNILRVRFNNSTISKFVNYFFISSLGKERLNLIKSGTTNVSAIYYKSLKDLKIPLPPLEEQKKIVAKLDELFVRIDKSISLLEENIQHTKDLMASVLDEEFGKLEENQIEINKVVKKTKTINPKVEYKDIIFTYIDISSINKELHYIEEPKELKGIDAPSRARKLVEKGDLIFATTRPNLKNIAVVSNDYSLPIASTGFCVLRVEESIISNEFLFYYLISERVQELIKPLIRGAQYPAISDKDLKQISIPLPSLARQKVIVSKIKKIQVSRNKLLIQQTEKLEHLKSLKSSLLDMAFKGELV